MSNVLPFKSKAQLEKESNNVLEFKPKNKLVEKFERIEATLDKSKPKKKKDK